MKKRILLPTSFFFSVLFTVFLFGFMIGFISLVRLMSDINKDSNSKNHTNSEENEAIVTVYKVLDGDTISIKLDDNLKKKLGIYYEKLYKYEINDTQKTNEIVISDTEINEIEINKIVIRVRLLGIDAPEDKSYSLEKNFYAPEAKKFVEDQINNKSIKINWDDFPIISRHRLSAYVYTQDEKGNYNTTSLNELILQKGYAWVYSQYKNPIRHSKEEQFNNLENEAKRDHKGVWNIEEKIKWQKEQGIIPSEKYNTYVIIGDFFHREWCDKVTDPHIKNYQKKYQHDRKKIEKNYTACERCNP